MLLHAVTVQPIDTSQLGSLFDTVAAGYAGASGVVVGAGRNGTSGVRASAGLANGLLLTIPARSTVFAAMAVKGVHAGNAVPNGANTAVLAVLDGADVQVSIHVGPDGTVYAFRGTSVALLGQSAPGALPLAPSYPHLAAKAVIHGSAGAVAVRVNNVEVLTLTNVNTQVSLNAQATRVAFIGATDTAIPRLSGDFCDWLVWDALGAQANDWLGDKSVTWVIPIGAGASSGSQVAGAPTRHQAVDETGGASAADFNFYTAVDQKNLYVKAAMPGGMTGIVAVAPTAQLYKNDAGAASGRLVVRGSDGATEAESGDLAATTVAVHEQFIQHVDPATGLPWTLAGLDAAQFGLKRSA